jgi:hypothetical protein
MVDWEVASMVDKPRPIPLAHHSVRLCLLVRRP